MKSLKKQRRIQVIAVTAVALALSTALIGYALRDGINYFRSPSEVLAEPPSDREFFRTGGLVVEDSIVAGEGVRFSFKLTDGGNVLFVKYVGSDPRPDLFDEGQGAVAEGYLRDGVFEAERILAKHDETYMPKEVLDALKEQGVYQEPES